MSELLPIREAAKRVHRSRVFVRSLIDRGEVTAVVSGGSPGQPRLRVNPDELAAAVRRASEYVPPGRPRKTHRRNVPLTAFAAGMAGSR